MCEVIDYHQKTDPIILWYGTGKTRYRPTSEFHTEGGGGGEAGISPPPPELCKHYDVIALKHEKMAVVLHTSDGKLGAVS